MSGIKQILIDHLRPHPQNPRISIRQDVVDAIAANLSGGFDPAHALIVRPVGDVFEIISGHHRWRAAKQAGLECVPCWVRDMDDDAAYMALVTSNSQGELSPLEIGMHALHCVALGSGGRGQKGGLSAYAEKVGRGKSTITELVNAARVVENCSLERTVLHDKTKHLSAIHALPESCWQAAVDAMLAGGWSAKDTAEKVKRANEFDFAPEYARLYDPASVLSHHFEYKDFAPGSFAKLIAYCQRIEATIRALSVDVDAQIVAFKSWLSDNKPLKMTALQSYEREVEAQMAVLQAEADQFKMGSWRDFVGDLDDGSVHLLLTDPPYGMDYQSNRRKDRHEKIANDGKDEAAGHLAECLAAMLPKMADDSHALIFTDWRNEAALTQAAIDAGLRVKGSLIWVKNNHGSGDLSGAFAPKHERIIHAVKGKPPLVKRDPDVFDSAKPPTDRHPTEKPVDLLARLIECTTVEGELVADPFAGVASTLVAAKSAGRKFWGCEIDPDYHAAGAQRL